MQRLLIDDCGTTSGLASMTRQALAAERADRAEGSQQYAPSLHFETPDSEFNPAKHSPSAPEVAESTLYVATNLECWKAPPRFPFATDVTLNGRTFRRLDALFWAWLVRKLDQARQARDAGTISVEAFAGLQARWARVHAWASERLAEADLRRAIAHFDEGLLYLPPGAERAEGQSSIRSASRSAKASPPPIASHSLGQGSFFQPAVGEALADVHTIRDQAIALSWTDEGLLRNRGRYRFPCGEDYGLVCFIGPEDRIGEVTREAIEIVGRDGRSGKRNIYNRAIERPWARRVDRLSAAA